MSTLEFKYADKGEQTKKINRFLLLGELVFSVFSTGIVAGSYFNGFRSLAYLLIIAGIMVIGNLLNFPVQ